MKHKKRYNNIRHMIVMASACIVPLAIIFALPFFGINTKWTIIGALGLMIFLHALMMKEHFLGYKQKGGAK